MLILIHSSKTMKPRTITGIKGTEPKFIDSAKELNEYLCSLSIAQIEKIMGVSSNLAKTTQQTIKEWVYSQKGFAFFSFRGDVYSGLQVDRLNQADIVFAQKHLRILSGLYGLLRPLDMIAPYRLEMGYKLPTNKYANLYKYWGTSLSDSISKDLKVLNLTSDEYGKAIIPNLIKSNVISPKFYTLNPKTNKPTTVAVHSKIARGAFAHWLIKIHAKDNTDLTKFNDIGYKFSKKLSSTNVPVFICKEFGGKGLSTRKND